MTKTLTVTISDADDSLLKTVALAKDQADTLLAAATKKRKKKTRRRVQRKFSRDDEGLYFNFSFHSYLLMKSVVFTFNIKFTFNCINQHCCFLARVN